MEYNDFLQTKVIVHTPSGFDVDTADLNDMLFDWQKIVVSIAMHPIKEPFQPLLKDVAKKIRRLVNELLSG